MEHVRRLIALTLPALGLLTTIPPAGAQLAMPSPVAEEVRQAQSDFSAGGPRRLAARWNACVRQVDADRDPDTARRCVAYGSAAQVLTGASAPLTQEAMAPAMAGMLDVMGVNPRLRRSYLSLFQKWASVDTPAGYDLGPGSGRGLGQGGAIPGRQYPGQFGGQFGGQDVGGFIPRQPFGRPAYIPATAPAMPAYAPPLSLPRAAPPAAQTPPAAASSSGASEVRLMRQGDTLRVPVVVNDSLTLRFTIDSGASDVSFSNNAVAALMRSGALTQADFRGKQTYTLADGSRVANDTFRIRTLRVGDREIHDVIGSVGGGDADLLLGQAFLSRFRSWSIDNQRGVLVLN